MVNTEMLGWTKYTFALYHDVCVADDFIFQLIFILLFISIVLGYGNVCKWILNKGKKINWNKELTATYAYDSQRLINPNRIETNRFCWERLGMLWVWGDSHIVNWRTNNFASTPREPHHSSRDPRHLVSTSCLLFVLSLVLSLLNVQVYKITKIVRAFWLVKNLWFIVPVNSQFCSAS